jgi:two-component system, OmpR family, sensor histidine kinase KdpD
MFEQTRKSPALTVFHIAVTIAVIAAITYVCSRLVVANSTTVALSFVVVVLGVSTAWGLAAGLAASVAGAICLSLFMPPIGVFWVADLQHWVAFVTFLIASAICSQLSATVARRRSEIQKLYELGSALLLLDSRRSVLQELAEHTRRTFGFHSVTIFSSLTDQSCSAGPETASQERMLECSSSGTAYRDKSRSVLPLRLAGSGLGSVAFTTRSVSQYAQDAIANLLALALERARVQEHSAHMEAARQSEQLKCTLLDAIAHEFKTPLTSLKAATGLLGTGDPADQGELLSIIVEETEYLDFLLGEAIEMGRIEAGKLTLDRQVHPVPDVLSAAMRRMGPALKDRTMRQEIPEGVSDVLVDREMIGLVIRQLVSNAVKYTPPDLPITIRVEDCKDQVQITVEDQGPGIPEQERTRIFEKYYRTPATSALVPGSGIGLAIAREIVQAHGGSIWVDSTAGQGSRFHITVPCIPREMKV